MQLLLKVTLLLIKSSLKGDERLELDKSAEGCKMPQPPIAVVALVSSRDAQRSAKRYLAGVTPASYPVICVLEGESLTARDRERIARADHTVLLSPVTSVVAGWLDELPAIAKDYPDVVVPISPNVTSSRP